MPEAGSLNQRATLQTSTDIVSEALIFSDVIKAGDFSTEDHVIFVVPESSDLVTSEADGETTRYVIPTSEGDISGSSFDTSNLRETIKSNFLVIAKLLPSKSPPQLLPFAAEETNETREGPADEGVVVQRITDLPKTLLPKPTLTKAPRQPKAPRQYSGKNQSSAKQEVPEIFGKMFPPSYNEVLWKQIKEIIYFKCGKDTTDDTEVAAGINCPHCRKKPSSLNQLKDHLNNCHTYSATKRKSTCPSGKSVIKKMLYRCQYCDEAFISLGMKESHECTLAAKPLEHLGGISRSHPNTCGICFQDFGSCSELSIHQELDHQLAEGSCEDRAPRPPASTPRSPVLPSISKYVSCKVCTKKVSVAVLEEHLRRHETAKTKDSAPAPAVEPKKCEPKKCDSCLSDSANLGPDSSTCDKCEERVICPICDVEMDSAAYNRHVDSHYSPSGEPLNVQITACQNCGDEFKVEPPGSALCKSCC